MRICLLTNQDLDAQPPPDDWLCDPRPYLPDASWDVLVLEKHSAVRQVQTAALRNYDLFFNLCDGAWDEGTPGVEVVMTLERLGVPFTGADSRFYEPPREAMKRVCRMWGIRTPDYRFVDDLSDADEIDRSLHYPMIVKHPSSYASIGLTRDSRVETVEELRTQIGRMVDTYGGALVEEFIEGIECTVLVAETPGRPEAPRTFQPMQYRFPRDETFKHSDLKWVDYADMECVPVQDAALDRALRDQAAAFFRYLDGVGYGRCDVRVDASGQPWMLEINANCGLYYKPEDAGSADLCLMADPAGHAGFTRQIVDAALARHSARVRPWSVRPRNGGYGTYARRPIGTGEEILRTDGDGHQLVDGHGLERRWRIAGAWLFQCGWPVSDQQWLIRGALPHEWQPIHHSCDPNAWLEGARLTARRAIAAGEEITIDFATIHDRSLPPFSCACGSARCRGTVGGDDHLSEAAAAYGHRTSAHVRSKRLEAGLSVGTPDGPSPNV
jgi:D-alanine-D-alanine ligase-like ATP-grasp enzyme